MRHDCKTTQLNNRLGTACCNFVRQRILRPEGFIGKSTGGNMGKQIGGKKVRKIALKMVPMKAIKASKSGKKKH